MLFSSVRPPTRVPLAAVRAHSRRAESMSRCWLMKSEPNTYSIDDLARDGRTHWDGVRNYQARNLMREMEVGDRVLFYHSNANPPGVVGLARVVKEAYPDSSAQDPNSHYYDEKATPEDPRWYMVDIEFVERLSRVCAAGRAQGREGPRGHGRHEAQPPVGAAGNDPRSTSRLPAGRKRTPDE